MQIAVIDADLIGRSKHNFPNLTCMKISGYFKNNGANVILKTDYDNLQDFDKVFIAKVFSDTPFPTDGLFGNILDLPNVEFGGTGFDFTKNKILPTEIEHAMPDYHLYDGFCDGKYYTDYSIGFLTRGCFRHCPFCVNKNSNKVVAHSPLAEFLDTSRPKICLLDDNFFGFKDWKISLLELIGTNKYFVFKQGLDVRLLDDARADLLFNSKYDGDFIFAFDDVKDSPVIEQKLKLIRRYTNKRVKFYVLCGYDRAGLYDENFWKIDLQNTFARIALLKEYDALPYIMRHKNYNLSPFRGMYITIAEYCNIPALFLKMSFEDFCHSDISRKSRIRYLNFWKKNNPAFSAGEILS